MLSPLRSPVTLATGGREAKAVCTSPFSVARLQGTKEKHTSPLPLHPPSSIAVRLAGGKGCASRRQEPIVIDSITPYGNARLNVEHFER